tara:strand:+ start:1104 stop:1442 length:339 start_codon:yes stop_codon:yes gene_type:complete
MIILRPNNLSQELKFIPREYIADKVILHNEETNTSQEYTGLTWSQEAYYLTTNIAFVTPELKNNTFYTLKVMNGTKIIYRDRIFCTDQLVAEYSMNKDEYVENETTNEYIVL